MNYYEFFNLPMFQVYLKGNPDEHFTVYAISPPQELSHTRFLIFDGKNFVWVSAYKYAPVEFIDEKYD
jgi:hypothetical protein